MADEVPPVSEELDAVLAYMAAQQAARCWWCISGKPHPQLPTELFEVPSKKDPNA